MVIMVAVFMVVVMLFFLHAGHNLLFLDGASEHVHQINHDTVFVDGVPKRVIHPAVGFAADIDEQVAVGNRQNIFRRRLIAVEIHAVIKQKRQLRIRSAVTENRFYPVIFREDGCNDTELPVPRALTGAAGGKTSDRQNQN